jgi:hypothetical protein
LDAGDYTLSYTVAGDGLCQLEATMSLTIEVDDCSSVDHNITNTLKVYPTSVQDILHITGEWINEVSIVDNSGRTINSYVIQAPKAMLDMQSFATGMYFLQVKSSQGQAVYKFIKL